LPDGSYDTIANSCGDALGCEGRTHLTKRAYRSPPSNGGRSRRRTKKAKTARRLWPPGDTGSKFSCSSSISSYRTLSCRNSHRIYRPSPGKDPKRCTPRAIVWFSSRFWPASPSPLLGRTATVGMSPGERHPELAISDEQREHIFSIVMRISDAPVASGPTPEITNVLPEQVPMQDLPADVGQDVPLVHGHKFVKFDDRILIVDPSSGLVVAMIPDINSWNSGSE
jgi:hypothetical protein